MIISAASTSEANYPKHARRWVIPKGDGPVTARRLAYNDNMTLIHIGKPRGACNNRRLDRRRFTTVARIVPVVTTASRLHVRAVGIPKPRSKRHYNDESIAGKPFGSLGEAQFHGVSVRNTNGCSVIDDNKRKGAIARWVEYSDFKVEIVAA